MGNDPVYDLCVIGGGINGAGIARDAAGRGLSVCLLEENDLASATSSASTKLIHGGLRYLEQCDFPLVHESLQERTTLLRAAPHIIWPLRFILPHDKNMRPYFMIRIGLYIYDFLGFPSPMPRASGINFNKQRRVYSISKQYDKAISYSDCWVEDARLVILNAVDAARRGARILPRHRCMSLRPTKDRLWLITARNSDDKKDMRLQARQVVNAAGPWARQFLDDNNLSRPSTPHVTLVKGSHIIVPRLYDAEEAFILQQPDGRIVFAIPYEHDYTLIGTTEETVMGDPADAAISAEETAYLCAAASRAFDTEITKDMIVATYSGVRPLLDEGNADQKAMRNITRGYRLDLDEVHGAPLLSIFGGKLTTYRQLAEKAVNMLTDQPKWTKTAPLPGGNFDEFERFLSKQKAAYTFLPPDLLRRYARAYGTLMDAFLENSTSLEDLGMHYGDGLYEAEMRYLIGAEWARTAEDILYRRTKYYLHSSKETQDRLRTALPALVAEETGQRGSNT